MTNAVNLSTAAATGFLRNRIINGDMRIDQRNAGASVTPVNGQYTLDRWQATLGQPSKFSVQQNAGAVTPPAGFTNYLGVTSLSAYAVTGNESFQVSQIVEGYNASDFNWGSASALPATLSFWVRSSLTGTFGGSIATTKTAVWVMPFSYTVSSANTWTYITVSIPAATSTGGTNNDNSAGIYVRFGLGSSGTASGGTAGTWTSAGNYIQPAGTVSVVGTNSATFYITGVQLEVGTVATPFERRLYGQEMTLCQRYFEKSFPINVAPAHNTGLFIMVNNAGSAGCGGNTYANVVYKVSKRAACTIRIYDPAGAASASTNAFRSITACNTGTQSTVISIDVASTEQFYGFFQAATAGTIGFYWTADAEL